MLETLNKILPKVGRFLLLKNGTSLTTAPGNLRPQLKEANIPEESVRAVYVRETSGLTVPVLAQHDIQKPMFLCSDAGTASYSIPAIRVLRSAIQFAHS
jgi:hypothetical protein